MYQTNTTFYRIFTILYYPTQCAILYWRIQHKDSWSSILRQNIFKRNKNGLLKPYCIIQVTTQMYIQCSAWMSTPPLKSTIVIAHFICAVCIGRDSHRNLSCLISTRIGEKTHCNAVNNDRGINTQFHVIKEHIIVYAQSCYLRKVPIHVTVHLNAGKINTILTV